MVERLPDRVAVIARGRVLTDGSLEEVRGADATLGDTFVRLVGSRGMEEGELAWLAS
ncbi:hypothetical protein [Nocardiopsis quinghaiensis]|uniref:hypothetical protein n=1 Tax=Nocardiopsis quinghaiensis TaxID=464995 RepID=UPI001CC24C7C